MDSTSVLNNPSGAADITLLAKKLNVAITSATGGGTFPEITYPNISQANVFASITESLESWKVTYVAANATEYNFTVSQTIDGNIITYTARLKDSGTAATADTIGEALELQFTNQPLQVTVVHTTGDSFLIVTGTAGNPLVRVTAGTNTTVTSNMETEAIVSSTNATPIVVTVATTAGITEGQTISISGHLVNTAANGTWKATSVGAATITLVDLQGNNSVGNGVGGATGTITLVAAEERGQGATLAADGVTGATSGNEYTEYRFDYSVPGTAQMGDMINAGPNSHSLYVNEGDAQFSAFDVEMKSILEGENNAAETARPSAFAAAVVE